LVLPLPAKELFPAAIAFWEGAKGGRFSFVFVSGGGDGDFEVYVHYPKL
jgi:hypothetical protein